MRRTYLFITVIFTLYLVISCNNVTVSDPLPSWNSTEIKTKIISFVENQASKLKPEERLAVFDMDGTIICESPLWMEMYCAVQGLKMQVEKNPELSEENMYRYALELDKDPFSKKVKEAWDTATTNIVEAMVINAFKGWNNKDYMEYCNNYLKTAKEPKYGMPLIETFYKPMIELIEYLKKNEFEVYIVSGSLQGLIWSVCDHSFGFDREHLIGTRQAMNPIYINGEETKFILQPEVIKPKNNNNGKAENIYSHIGRTPIFAFGNTTGDFGMFHITTTNTLPNVSFLLNHNDAEREYMYKPWHGKAMPTWRDTMQANGWNIVNMKENFKTVFLN